jgi:hypothetical protein
MFYAQQPSTTTRGFATQQISNKNKKEAKQNKRSLKSWIRAGYSAQVTKHTNSYVESSTSSEVLATFSNRLSAQNPG